MVYVRTDPLANVRAVDAPQVPVAKK